MIPATFDYEVADSAAHALSLLAELPTMRQDPPANPVAGPHRPQFEYTPEEQAIIEQRLADLGYLE